MRSARVASSRSSTPARSTSTRAGSRRYCDCWPPCRPWSPSSSGGRPASPRSARRRGRCWRCSAPATRPCSTSFSAAPSRAGGCRSNSPGAWTMCAAAAPMCPGSPATRCSTTGTGSAWIRHDSGEHRRLADIGALGRGEQRERAFLGQPAQVRQRLGPLRVLQLLPVAAAELLEAVRVVVVPGAQLPRRRDVLAPFVQRRLGLAQPARPEPVDEHSGAIVRLRLVISPAYPDFRCLYFAHGLHLPLG